MIGSLAPAYPLRRVRRFSRWPASIIVIGLSLGRASNLFPPKPPTGCVQIVFGLRQAKSLVPSGLDV
jgi:hypothetical protein